MICIFGCLVEPSVHPKTSYRGIWNQETAYRGYDIIVFWFGFSIATMLSDSLEKTRMILMYEKAVSTKSPSVVEGKADH